MGSSEVTRPWLAELGPDPSLTRALNVGSVGLTSVGRIQGPDTGGPPAAAGQGTRRRGPPGLLILGVGWEVRVRWLDRKGPGVGENGCGSVMARKRQAALRSRHESTWHSRPGR